MLYLCGTTLTKKLSDDKAAATPVTLLDVGDGAVWLDTPYSGGRAQLVPGAIKRVEGTQVACAKVNGPRPDQQQKNRRWHLLSQADGGYHIRFVTEPEFYLSIQHADCPFVLSKTPRIWYTQVEAPVAEESVSPVAEVPVDKDAMIASLQAEIQKLKAALKCFIDP